MTNIISDIAGEYEALLKLVDKMPEGETISVGDMVDRGPDSNAVLEYFRRPGRRAVLGNHEHMMLDYYLGTQFYQTNWWRWGWGQHTVQSFPGGEPTKEQIEWLKNLPKYIEIDGCLISHAFLRKGWDLKECCKFGMDIHSKQETTIIWNRSEPVRQPDYRLQITGHNSQFGLREWRDDQGLFAICLDDSRKRVLTGLHLETLTIYQQPYIK